MNRRGSRRIVLIAVTLCVISAGFPGRLRAADVAVARSKVGHLQTIPLPENAELEDFALSADGMLFVADKQKVRVKSPWGWDEVWRLPPATTVLEPKIRALTVVPVADGTEALLVGTEDGIWPVRWKAEANAENPWSVFPLHFAAGPRLPSKEGEIVERMGIAELYPLPRNSSGACALAVGRSGGPRLVIADHGGLRLGAAPFGDNIFQSLTTFPLPDGSFVCQEYPDHELRIVSAAGVELRKTDLGSLLGGKSQVRAVLADADRKLVFVGTNRGVVVAHWEENQNQAAEWQVVEALRDFDAVYLGKCASRLLAMGNSAGDTKDAVQWETIWDAPVRDAQAARAMKFEPASGGPFPSGIKEALAVAEDGVWVRGLDQAVFEWTPRQWRRLSFADHGGLDAVGFWRAKARAAPPLVIPGVLLDHLTWLVPWDPRRVAYHELDNPLAALAPDPSGAGLWSLDQPVQGLGKTFHAIRFHSLHGQFETTDAIRYGNHPSIGRLSHPVSRGAEFANVASVSQGVYYPEAGDGSLLLPSGSDFLRVAHAQWRLLQESHPLPPGDRLVELTPGAASSDAPWLGLQQHADGSADLIELGLDETGTKWQTKNLGERIPARSTARLIPESTGHVWLATHAGGETWTMKRIGPDKLVLEFAAPSGQTPRFIISRKPSLTFDGVLFKRTVDRHCFFRSGVSTCEDEKPGRWRHLLSDGPLNSPEFLDLFYSDREACVRTGTIDLGGNVTTASTYQLSWTGGDAGLTVPPAPAGQQDTQPFAFFPKAIAGEMSALWTMPDTRPRDSQVRSWWTVSSGAKAPFPEWDENSFSLPLPRLPYFQTAALIHGSAFKNSTPDMAPIVAASGPTALALIPPASFLGWENWAIPVPATLIIRHRNGREEIRSLRDGPFPAELEPDVVSIGLRFARNYDAWWQTNPLRLRGRAVPVQAGDAPPWTIPGEDLRLDLAMEAGRRYVLEFENAEASGVDFQGIKTLPIAVQAEPQKFTPKALAAIVALGLAVAALALMVFSRLARRAVLRILGRRWVFRAASCEIMVEAERSAAGATLTADRGAAVAVRYDLDGDALQRCARGEAASWQTLRENLLPPPGPALRTICVRSPESLFHFPMSLWLDGGWAVKPADELSAGTVGGQTALLAEDLGNPPAQLKRVHCATIGWRGDPPLLIEPELQEIEHAFRRMRAVVLPRGETPADLLSALCEADIVHVAAHASLTEIELRDNPFTAALLSDEFLRRVRCRLLILSACDAGQTAPGQPSIAWPLIRAGVTIIGSLIPLDDTVGRRYFPLLYQHFLPVTTAGGPTLAEAIVQATKALAPILGDEENAPWRGYINRLALYGTPQLQLSVFHPTPNE